jgi:arylsulfatase A-like enzyme
LPAAPRDFYDVYPPAALPELTQAGLPHKPDFHDGIRRAYGLTNLLNDIFRKIRAVYYGQVSYSDWLLGELLEAIKKNGRQKDTPVFVTSDHGDIMSSFRPKSFLT